MLVVSTLVALMKNQEVLRHMSVIEKYRICAVMLEKKNRRLFF